MKNKIPIPGTLEWKAFIYKRMKEENRGRNFQYWNASHDDMLKNGWEIFLFYPRGYAKEYTDYLDLAKSAVETLRSKGNFARIVCGYEQCRQRIKYYTVIFKPKKNKSSHDIPRINIRAKPDNHNNQN